MAYEIGVIVITIFILWIIDKILLYFFGSKWRMTDKYEEEKEKRQFWRKWGS
jgi:hypothetical protein